MNVISSIYNRYFYKDYNDKEYVELESQGFEDYVKDLEEKNSDLSIKLKFERETSLIKDESIQKLVKVNDSLSNNTTYLTGEVEKQEKELLKERDKNSELEKENAKLKEENKKLNKENSIHKNYNEMLQNSNLNMGLKQTILENKVTELEKKLEFTGKPLEAIEKLTNERDIYKNIINTICDKYNIDNKEVISIIDSIQADRGTEMQR